MGKSRRVAPENLTVSFVEVPEGERRAENLVEILSEAVCAYLKHKGRGARNRHFGVPKIELTTARNRAGIGTEDGVGGVNVTEALGASVKAKR